MQVRILSIDCDDVIECQAVRDQDIQCTRAENTTEAINQLHSSPPDIILFKDSGSNATSEIELLHEIGRFSREHRNCRVTALLPAWDTPRVRKLVQAGVGHFFVWPANREIVDDHLHRQIEQVKFAKFRAVQFKEETSGESNVTELTPRSEISNLEARIVGLRKTVAELRREYFFGPTRADHVQALFQKMEDQLISLASLAGAKDLESAFDAPSSPTSEGAKILEFPKKVA